MSFFLPLFFISTVLLAFLIRYLLDWLAKSYTFQLFGKMITRVETNEKAIALTPNNYEAYDALGVTYIRMENDELAKKQFQIA